MANPHPTHGTPGDDVVTIHPGDVFNGGPGNDTISMEPLIGTGGNLDRAFVFGGTGDDTILDFSVKEAPVPLTAAGGPGDDTFFVSSVGAAGTVFTGGPGHDLFHFSTVPFHGADATITDFSSHDAIMIDVDPLHPPTISITAEGRTAEVNAIADGK